MSDLEHFRLMIREFLVSDKNLKTAAARVPPSPRELMQAGERLNIAYEALAALVEFSPVAFQRHRENASEAAKFRELNSSIAAEPLVIDARHLVMVAQWHYRPPKLAKELAYLYVQKDAEAGRDPWHVIDSTDREESERGGRMTDWYGIGLRGHAKFTQVHKTSALYVTEKNYRTLMSAQLERDC